MHPDARNEALAALREIYDGGWTRHVGMGGGIPLAWRGKIGLLFGATSKIDAHYAVIGQMGDRFLFSRLAPTPQGQFTRALQHQGALNKQMRKELAETVAHLFTIRTEPRLISTAETDRIDRVISLVVRLRGAVERDRYSRDVEAVYGAEGTARIGLALERILAGLDTLGVERDTALNVIEKIAMDSTPPLRRQAYEYLCQCDEEKTPDIAEALSLPTNTVRRALEDLMAYGLVSRKKDKEGGADLWMIREGDW
jgi:hypothetical protein